MFPPENGANILQELFYQNHDPFGPEDRDVKLSLVKIEFVLEHPLAFQVIACVRVLKVTCDRALIGNCLIDRTVAFFFKLKL